jgi:hypothetical protein
VLFLWIPLLTAFKNLLKDTPNLLTLVEITLRNKEHSFSLYFIFHTSPGTSLHYINRPVFAIEMQCVIYAAGTEILYVIHLLNILVQIAISFFSQVYNLL